MRDLASGMQLLWLPVPEATAGPPTAALALLFRLHGAPLVLKIDNGAPFLAGAMAELLAQWGVMPLYSPPGRPQYNGAVEAGIGALKVRPRYQAVRQGRPGEWTLEDTEAARQEANTLGRPWGAHGPTPAERWAVRVVVTPGERAAFAASVACLKAEPAPSPRRPARELKPRRRNAPPPVRPRQRPPPVRASPRRPPPRARPPQSRAEQSKQAQRRTE